MIGDGGFGFLDNYFPVVPLEPLDSLFLFGFQRLWPPVKNGGRRRGDISFFPQGYAMQDGGYDLGGCSVPLTPFPQFFLKFVPYFFPL